MCVCVCVCVCIYIYIYICACVDVIKYSFWCLFPCLACFAFYFVCFLFLFCIVLCTVSPLVYSSLFPIFVPVYRPLPPGGNPVAVNKHNISCCTISYNIPLKIKTETVPLSLLLYRNIIAFFFKCSIWWWCCPLRPKHVATIKRTKI